MVYTLLSGMLVMGCWVSGLFFFRFWKQSRDRLFLLFGLAFWILAAERCLLVLMAMPRDETDPRIYLIRLLGFVVILWAIVDKNRSRKA